MLASDLGDRGPFKAMKKKLANNWQLKPQSCYPTNKNALLANI